MARQAINLGAAPGDGTGTPLRTGGDYINDNFIELYGRSGFFDYNDDATSTTPISLTGGGGYVFLTNDELGTFTNKSYPPSGVTDVWDATSNEFDWSELPLGSKIHVRLDLQVTTNVANQVIEGAIELAIGGSSYDLIWFREAFKSSGTYPIVKSSFVYMGDTNTQLNPAKFKVKSDGNADVVVNGWACYITKYTS